MLPAGLLHRKPHPLWDSRRLWSLWDMINFGLGEFLHCLEFIDYHLMSAKATQRDSIVSVGQHFVIKNNLANIVLPLIGKLNISDARIASIKLEDLINRWGVRQYTYGELSDCLERLREDFLEGCKHEYFFHYPKEMAALATPIIQGFVNLKWQSILEAFPSAKKEIEAGLDSYAFGDLSGCVFHMMRIAELGLRAIARERGITKVGSRRNKPLEWGTWKDVSDAIRGKIKEIQPKAAGPKRDAALAFYENALDKMRFMQGLYRDPTMHFRDKYEQGEAFDAISNTFSFMATLATKLDEIRPHTKIRWGL